MFHSSLSAIHITAGAAGLILGPLTMAARKRPGWYTHLGVGYQAAVATTTTSALGLVALAPARLWWLGLIAAATEAAALGGWWVRRGRRPGWLPRHIRLMCGSYVSFVTAALVVSWGGPVSWLLPAVVATPLIEVTAHRAARATSGANRGCTTAEWCQPGLHHRRVVPTGAAPPPSGANRGCTTAEWCQPGLYHRRVVPTGAVGRRGRPRWHHSAG